jgi:predicted kinase
MVNIVAFFIMTKALIIIRGLPGSGKTTLAKLLSENGKYPCFSVDDFFTDEAGNYKFDFEKNYLAYKSCEKNTEQAMLKGESKIFLHNVFSMEWEIAFYLKLAATCGYQVHFITTENRHGGKNTHAITDEQLKKMAENFNVKLI